MKLLTRLLLINWHFYSKEMISFDKINFLTGKTGAGKSTVIDALQIVLLGDTQGNRFFNKAASDRSRRSLKGYLRGEYGDNGDTGFLYLRNSPFSSYIVCEVYDTEKRKSISFGIAFDCNYTATDESIFFILKDRIPEDTFVKDDLPMEIKDLKFFLKKNYDRSQWDVLTTANEYQEKLLSHLGGLNRRYFRLLKQAVSFTPITDIEKFITDNICEKAKKIDLSSMQENLRQYRRLEREAEEIQKRIQMLEEIHNVFSDMKEEENKYTLYDFLITRSDKENAVLAFQKAEKELLDTEAALKIREAEIKRIAGEKEVLDTRLERLRNERAANDLYQRKEKLIGEKASLEAEITRLSQELRKQITRLTEYGIEWRDRANRAASLSAALREAEDFLDPELQSEEFFAAGKALLDTSNGLLAIREETIDTWTQDKALMLQTEGEAFNSARVALFERIRAAAEKAGEDLEDCRTRIDELKKDIKPFDKTLVRFRDDLAARLAERSGHPVSVDILADLLEIRTPRWVDVIEGYLRKQKQYILVPPEYYPDAIAIYDEQRREKRLFDISLIDGEKVLAKGYPARPGSLAEEIETGNPYAKAYINFLIGDLMKCDRISDLRKNEKSVTDRGLLYQSYVTGSINPGSWETHLIGRKSIRQQLDKMLLLEPKLAGKAKHMEDLRRKTGTISPVEAMNRNEAQDFFNHMDETRIMPSLREQVVRVEIELNSLDLSWVLQLDRQIIDLEEKKRKGEATVSGLAQEIGGLKQKRQDLAEDRIPEAAEAVDEMTKRCLKFAESIRNGEGEARFQSELSARKDPMKIVSAFASQLSLKRNSIDAAKANLHNRRSDYNKSFNYSFNVADSQNTRYDQHLATLKEQELPKYADRIIRAKDLAYAQFGDQFLAQMKQNIEEVRNRISELNAALRNYSWGNEKFSFQVRENPEYKRFYDMITDPMLLMEGYTLTTQAFQDKHKVAIDELFKKIADTGTDMDTRDRETLEKNIALYTDYKTYLRFDMISTDENNRHQRLSRTLEKKSGGETQTPFYIAILASFAQLYRIQDIKSNTFRLILFDEAFSKMDGERIRESIQLLKKIGFQCIISAPPDKIADIATLVDHNIVAIRNGQSVTTHAFNIHDEEIEELLEEEDDHE